MGVMLLDTHVLLWLLSSPERIPASVLDRLEDPSERMLVSAVSALEVATKTRLGKLEGAPLLTAWSAHVERIRAEELAISTAHALTAGSMAWDNRDPFDRVLAAQAIHLGAELVTVDRAFAGLAAPAVVTW